MKNKLRKLPPNACGFGATFATFTYNQLTIDLGLMNYGVYGIWYHYGIGEVQSCPIHIDDLELGNTDPREMDPKELFILMTKKSIEDALDLWSKVVVKERTSHFNKGVFSAKQELRDFLELF